MRIAFLQEELYPYLGFMYLASVAKGLGHEVEVFIKNVDRNFLDGVRAFQPNLACFSTTTPNYAFARETARNLKNASPEVFILMGGWHPTFYPEVLDQETCFDAICRGEGERPFRALLKAFFSPERLTTIANLDIRMGGAIHRNPLGDLIDNLDEIAFPDRSVYYEKYDLLRDVPTKIFTTGRGCPFPCAYCFNQKMKGLYEGKGRYVRLRSPENIVAEIKAVRERYPVRYIQFFDDTFNANKKWLMRFLELYRTEVGIPFLANCRINMLDEEMVAGLKAAGLDKMNISIEHGNEKIRRELLRREMSNAEILAGGALVRKHQIRLHISNMVGFPGETIDLALETLRMNQQMQPEFAAMHVMQPYPGTEIYDLFKRQGHIAGDFAVENMPALSSWGTPITHVTSIIKQENINQLVNLHSFFSFLVQHPRGYAWVKPLLALTPNKYFEFFQAWYIFKGKFKYATNTRERLNYTVQLTRNLFPDIIQRPLEAILGRFGVFRQK